MEEILFPKGIEGFIVEKIHEQELERQVVSLIEKWKQYLQGHRNWKELFMFYIANRLVRSHPWALEVGCAGGRG